MDKQQAAKEIAENLALAHEMIRKCVDISEASGVGFDLPWGGEGSSESGMGAYYSPTGDSQTWHDRNGWNPSAHTC